MTPAPTPRTPGTPTPDRRMTYNDLLLAYARNGLFTPIRKSAFRKFCRRNRGKRFIADCRGRFSMVTIIGDSVDDQIFVHGVFEENTSTLIENLAREARGFVDVGCNIGYYTCLFLAAAPGKPAVAVDANPAMTARTRENLELNRFSGCEILHCAIADKPGRMPLNIPERRHSLSSLAYVPAHGGPVHRIEVETKTLTEVLNSAGLERCLVKIDTEGFECQVFAGLDPAAADTIHFIVFELSGPNLEQAGKRPQDIFNLPVLNKFDAFLIPERPRTPLRELTPEILAKVARDGLSVNVLLVNKQPAAREAFQRCGIAVCSR